MPRTILLVVLLMLGSIAAANATISAPAPVRVGIAGLTHAHVHVLLGRAQRGDVEIVGIAEPNRDLAQRLTKQYGLSMKLVYPTLEEMLVKTKPQAVTAFTSIYDHLAVVQACAPRGVHVMVEKPLAVSVDHARQMAALANKHHIHLLTNYETSWYGTNHRAYELVTQQKTIGDIRKMVVHDGHQGPKAINVNPEFLEWLTDPVQNGGGALIDFGCYGADLMTWLMQGQRPQSVTAVTQHLQPQVYPRVDDEATIVVTYPHAQGIIQASWNWPYSRKDMEIYGQTGAVFALDSRQLRVRPTEKAAPQELTIAAPKAPYDEPFAYLAAVVRGDIQEDKLSSLDTNLIVVEILDAARQSAKEGKTIFLSK
ncbi:Gfo/Idh/MocA family protein [Hymenobacter defluvii]|uniref:Gfo/Idh/MocA family oxidoreductase n=1 Tax=Hymenobacter defluvii TaxID=2054411 RepID=A0ABS3TAN4_9BACT|nr:Gfo/Idh/MocA family oxidoreductase [Hymenobacter defluvii]MBO3270692.1 Gfo/Idh/MocA family oxidoreductase [Hymenobacter defluvii]